MKTHVALSLSPSYCAHNWARIRACFTFPGLKGWVASFQLALLRPGMFLLLSTDVLWAEALLGSNQRPVGGMLSEVPRKFLVGLWSHPVSGMASSQLVYVCWFMMRASSEKYMNLNWDRGNLDQKNVIMSCTAVKHFHASVHSHSQSTWLFPHDRVYYWGCSAHLTVQHVAQVLWWRGIDCWVRTVTWL